MLQDWTERTWQPRVLEATPFTPSMSHDTDDKVTGAISQQSEWCNPEHHIGRTTQACHQLLDAVNHRCGAHSITCHFLSHRSEWVMLLDAANSRVRDKVASELYCDEVRHHTLQCVKWHCHAASQAPIQAPQMHFSPSESCISLSACALSLWY